MLTSLSPENAPFRDLLSPVGSGGERPADVGIHAVEVYFPKTSVRQVDLEAHAGVAPGKFTIGLGQQNMAFCGELEDINSMMLTAVQNLLEKYGVDPLEVGRLEVGTETLIDKSKSVKSTLCQLFTEAGNNDLEGIDSVNACYGGTAALLNSLSWVESSAWDGRYALVVCGDIAVYEPGPARPTGGCAAVAMLVGPNAPLAVDGPRASHMENAYDFYKPNLDSEYPVVFGHESNVCYLNALDNCYQRYAHKFEAARARPFQLEEEADHVIFHSPYNKLVKKSGARMLLNDFTRYPDLPVFTEAGEGEEGSGLGVAAAEAAAGKALEDTYYDRDVEKAFISLARPMYEEKVHPSTLLPRELGNSYTASCYTGLLSLIDAWHKQKEDGAEGETSVAAADDGDKDDHVGKNVLMFSYGSGLASTLFSIRCAGDTSHIAERADLDRRLAAREFKTPEEFTETLTQREKRYNQKGYSPTGDPEKELFPGTYYLAENDEHGRRRYARTPLAPDAQAQVQAAAAAAWRKVAQQKNAGRAKVARRAFSTLARVLRR